MMSSLDENNIEGLCGTFDNDCTNDFLLRDGSISKHSGAQSHCGSHGGNPNDFSNSWRYVWYRLTLSVKKNNR